MDEQVVEQFSRSFFPGLIEVNFFERKGERHITFLFNTNEDVARAIQNAEHASKIFWVDDKMLMVNRDAFETVMYMTAVKGATDSWIMRFGERVERERLLEDEN